jgi:hypothetical protein
MELFVFVFRLMKLEVAQVLQQLMPSTRKMIPTGSACVIKHQSPVKKSTGYAGQMVQTQLETRSPQTGLPGLQLQVHTTKMTQAPSLSPLMPSERLILRLKFTGHHQILLSGCDLLWMDHPLRLTQALLKSNY